MSKEAVETVVDDSASSSSSDENEAVVASSSKRRRSDTSDRAASLKKSKLFDDEASESDEEEHESKKNSRKATGFFDDEAEDSDSDEDEEKLAALRRKEAEDEENVSEDVRKLRDDMAIRLKKRQEQKQLLKGVTLEDQVLDVKQRAKEERQRLREAMSSGKVGMSHGQHLPTPSDPRLFMVKCLTGKERILSFQLMNKARSLTRRGKTPQIFSVTATSTRGYIYVEAYREDVVKKFIQGIAGLFLTKTLKVPLEEMTDVFHISTKKSVLKVGQWVRMKGGVYRDDLGCIETKPDPQGRIVVRLIPRIDYVRKEQPKEIYMKSYLVNFLNEKLRTVQDGINVEVEEACNNCLDDLQDLPRITKGKCKHLVYDPTEGAQKTLEAIWTKGENKLNAERAREKNLGARPPQKFFDISELEQGFGEIDPRDKGVTMDEINESSGNSRMQFTKFRGEYFHGGFLYKRKVTVKQVNPDVKPTVEELQQFQSHSTNSQQNADSDSDSDPDGESGEGVSTNYSSGLAKMMKNSAGSGLKKLVPFEAGDLVVVTSADLKGMFCRVVRIDHVNLTARVVPEPNPKNLSAFDMELENLRKHFQSGMHIKVINGRFLGDTGTVVRIEQDTGEATVLNDSQTREFVVYMKDIQESNDVSKELNILAGYKLYDLVQIGVGGQRGVIVKIRREHFEILDTRGVLQSVRPVEVSRTLNKVSERTQTTDSNRQYISNGDWVTITSGKDKGKTGTIKWILSHFVFLYSRDVQKNAGIMVTASRNLKLAGYASNKDLSTISMGVLGADMSGKGPVGGMHSEQLARTNMNKITDRDRKDMHIGESVRITKGDYKGKIGIVLHGTESHRTIELHSQNRKVTVPAPHVQLVVAEDGHVVEKDFTLGGGITPGSTGYGGITPGGGFGGLTPGGGFGGTTPGSFEGTIGHSGIGGFTPMLGGMTPGGFGFNNEGEWDTPGIKTPLMQTPAPIPSYDDGADAQYNTMHMQHHQSYNQQYVPGPSSVSSFGASSYGQQSSYLGGPEQFANYTHAPVPGMGFPPTPVDPAGMGSGYPPSGYAYTPSGAMSTGAMTPVEPPTPGSMAGSTMHDDGGTSGWKRATTVNIFRGLVVLVDGYEGTVISSDLNRAGYHNVLVNGQQRVLHESSLQLVKVAKNDSVVVVGKHDYFGARGTVTTIGAEDDIFVTFTNSAAGDDMEYFNSNVKVGKLNSEYANS
jgi:transcription elongation factor